MFRRHVHILCNQFLHVSRVFSPSADRSNKKKVRPKVTTVWLCLVCLDLASVAKSLSYKLKAYFRPTKAKVYIYRSKQVRVAEDGSSQGASLSAEADAVR